MTHRLHISHRVQNTDIEATDWQHFESDVHRIRARLGERSSPLLFRGQSNADWQLQTTLERAGYDGMAFADYFHLILRRVRHAVESFTSIEVPQYPAEFNELFQNRELLTHHCFPPEDVYRYMIYLRHHGFPSPLLDWSHSQYVAGYFAFREASPDVEKVAIYAFCEEPQGMKGGTVGGPTIRQTGQYVAGDRRHFRQQSNYTLSGEMNEDTSLWKFCSHDKILSQRRFEQDVLWKFTIPSTERTKVLRLLNEYNLNAFSLFDSEETLLETLWLREHVLKNSP